jgi:DNA processing protein
MSGPRELRPADPSWPAGLTHLEQPPERLWILGAGVPGSPAVAVVGSRRATFAGLDIARAIGRELGDAGVQVISGMARGIDGAAHRGALEAGGSTVAVLGCGIDVCYPQQHRQLRDEIAARGCVISEEPPGTPPRKPNFPKRNRLIAALCSAVVVVEATPRSGALSTARWAADLGREVLAVPGSIRSPQSAGTNLLVRDGARPFLGINDLFEAVGGLGSLDGAGRPDTTRGSLAARWRSLAAPLQEILRRMGPDPVHPDAVGSALGLPAAVVAARLGALELAGAVMSLPGGLVARNY